MSFRKRAARDLGRLLLLGSLLATAACNEKPPTEPEDTGGDPQGTWTAVSFAGASLPINEYVNDPEWGICLQRLEDVQIVISSDGTYTWTESVLNDCSATGGPEPSTATNTFPGTWRVDGIWLYLTGDESGVEQGSTFTVSSNQLTLHNKVGGTTLTSVFQRSL